MPESIASSLSKMLIESSSNKQDPQSKRAFIVKITNYELLSIMLPQSQLKEIVLEATSLIRKVLTGLDVNYNYEIATLGRYILFFSDKNIRQSEEELALIVFTALQLHVFHCNPSTVLECKISSIETTKNHNKNQQIIQGALTEMVINNDNGFFIPFNPLAVKNLESDYRNIIRFKKALMDNSISFAYQPIIERKTSKVSYFECLLRIPEHGADRTSAGPYIVLSEHIGMNNILDQIVLKMVVQELEAAPEITLAINISNSGILDNNLKELAIAILPDRHIAERLIIEITETSLNSNFEKTKEFLEAMRMRGCKIALDDFGAGFTSFKQLQKLPLDIIKIDGSFIKNILLSDSSKFLVTALIELASKLGAKTVAEFVESAEIAKALCNLEIDYMQGDFFSPAMNQRLWNK